MTGARVEAEVCFPRRFYGKAVNEVDAGHEAGANRSDPRKCHMDRPGAAPNVAPGLFVRSADLDG